MRILTTAAVILSVAILLIRVADSTPLVVTTAHPQISRDTEIRMALGAAPAQLRADAGVYVLGSRGYIAARVSRNGFHCLVERGVTALAPVCYDAEGSSSTMQASLRRAALIAAGATNTAANDDIAAQYRNGSLHAPRKGGVAYMLSADFTGIDRKTGKRHQLYPPHMMIYAPYLRNRDIGVGPSDVRSMSRLWVEQEGKPDAMIIVTQNMNMKM